LIQTTMETVLVCLNCHVAHAVSHAREKYYPDIRSKIHDNQMNSPLAREHICLLTKGKMAHHSKKTWQ
jgi:hypothetical protein